MVKAVVIEDFTLEKFKELKNIIRNNPNKDLEGKLYVKDTFECTEKMAEYLTKTNALGRPFIEIIEVVPDKEEKPRDTTKKTTKKASANK